MKSNFDLLIVHYHKPTDIFCFLLHRSKHLFYLCYWVQINLFVPKNTLKITSISLFNLSMAMFLIICKITCIDCSIFIKILSFSVFPVLKPITYKPFSFHIIVFPFPLLKTLKEIALISLRINIFHLSPSMWFTWIYLTFVLCAIW